MRNFPKNINTRQDVINLLSLYPEETKAYLKRCIDGYKNFIPVSEHENRDECIKDETHDYIETESNGAVKYIQREFKVVPGNDLDRLGITIEEAKQLLLNN